MTIDAKTQTVWLRLGEAAGLLGLSPNTLRRWTDTGRLPCFRSPGGHRRYRLQDIHALLEAGGATGADPDQLADRIPRSSARPPSPSAPSSLSDQRPSLDAQFSHSGSAAAGQLLSHLATSTASGLDVDGVVVLWTIADTPVVVAAHSSGRLIDCVPGLTAPARILDLLANADPATPVLRPTPAAESKAAEPEGDSPSLPPAPADSDEIVPVLLVALATGRGHGALVIFDRSDRCLTDDDLSFAQHMAVQLQSICPHVDVNTLPTEAHGPSVRPPLASGSANPFDALIPQPRSRLFEKPDVLPESLLASVASLLRANALFLLWPNGREIEILDRWPRGASLPDRLLSVATQIADPAAWPDLVPCDPDQPPVTITKLDGEYAAVLPLVVGARLARDFGSPPATGGVHGEAGSAARESDSAPASRSAHARNGRSAVDGLLAADRDLTETAGYVLVAAGCPAPPDSRDACAVAQLLAHELERDLEHASLRKRAEELQAVAMAAVEDHELLSYEAILRATARRLSELTHTPVVDIYAVEGNVLRSLVSYDNSSYDIGWQDITLPLERYPCSVAAVATRRPAMATNLDDPVLEPFGRSSLEKWGYQAQLAVPLLAAGQVIGLAELSDYVPRDFTPELDLIQRLTHSAAHALQNAALLQNTQRAEHLARTLSDLGATLAVLHDEDEILAHVATVLREELDVTRCDVYELRSGQLACRVRAEGGRQAGGSSHGTDTAALVSAAASVLPIPLADTPLTSQAIEQRSVVMVATPLDTQLSPQERHAYAVAGFSSEVIVPLYVGNEIFGVINLLDRRPRDHRDYRSFLETAGQVTQAALHTAHLLQQVQRRSAILREIVGLGEIASQLHSAEVDVLVHAVANKIRTVLGAAYCDIFSVEDGRLRCLVSVDEHGPDESLRDKIVVLDKYRTTRAALDSGEPFVIASLADERLSDEEIDNYGVYGLQSELGIPIVAGDRTIGFIDIFDTRPRDYAEHLDFTRSLGQIVAGALENALLLQRLERTLREQRVLVDSALSFGATLDLHDVLLTIARHLEEVGQASHCDIYRITGNAVQLLVSVQHGEEEPPPDEIFTLDDLPTVARALATRTPILVRDIRTDPYVSDFERRGWLSYGYLAGIEIPLLMGGEVPGMVVLYSRESRDFANLGLLQGLAQIAAQALTNADLFSRTQQQTREAELLNALARRITASLDLREICRLALEQISELVPFTGAVVALFGDDGILVPAFSTVHGTPSLPAAVDRDRLERLLNDPGSQRQVQALLEASLPSAIAARSDHIAVCLRDSDRAAGVLYLAADRAHSFQPAAVRTLDRIATHLTLALTNARLYESIKRLHLGNLRALSSALSVKDYYTLGHAARVAAYMVLMARELGWPQHLSDQIEEVAYLHDVGKIGVSDRVLLTAAPLNAREWEIMRQHPVISADILDPLFPSELVLGVRHHHERYEGGGYPDGIAGEDIPVVARAMCVADAYDAMSYERPYRDPLNYKECREELIRCRGSQFDPEMVDAFLRVLDRLDDLRQLAERVATDAARSINPELHQQVVASMDPTTAEYDQIAETLRRVRDEHQPVRFLVTAVRGESDFMIVVDPEEDSDAWSPPGEDIVGAGTLHDVYEGRAADRNVLYLDRFGVWMHGAAPIIGPDGQVAGLVAADIPPVAGVETDERHSGVAQSFAALMDSTGERLAQARMEAITDYLTGLYNHRYLHERLQEELARAREQVYPLSVLFLDIDQFKDFNDRYGHSIGDNALRMVGSIIDRSVRRLDLAARYGGEEFVVVLVDTGRTGAMEVAERIRSAIAAAPVPNAGSVSVSVGVASFPEDAEFREELLDKADWAMYMAKRSGRNRVSSFSSGQLRFDFRQDGGKESSDET